MEISICLTIYICTFPKNKDHCFYDYRKISSNQVLLSELRELSVKFVHISSIFLLKSLQ